MSANFSLLYPLFLLLNYHFHYLNSLDLFFLYLRCPIVCQAFNLLSVQLLLTTIAFHLAIITLKTIALVMVMITVLYLCSSKLNRQIKKFARLLLTT